jgi:hypothetical protein
MSVLRIRDVYPESRISNPGSKNSKKEGVKKNCCLTFFCSNKYHNIKNYFIFEQVEKKNWAKLQRIIELFIQKLSISSQKYRFGIEDPEKNLFRMSDPEESKRHRIPDPQHLTRADKKNKSHKHLVINGHGGDLVPL